MCVQILLILSKKIESMPKRTIFLYKAEINYKILQLAANNKCSLNSTLHRDEYKHNRKEPALSQSTSRVTQKPVASKSNNSNRISLANALPPLNA